MNRDTEAVLDEIMDTVAATAPEIRACLPERRRPAGEQNPSGESQMAADVYTDQLLADRLGAIDGVGTFGSEERTKIVRVSEGRRGGLSVGIDPLDGSWNLKSNNVMGTILAVYDASLPASGDDILAAAYLLYGPITTMIVARDGEVTEYRVDDGERKEIAADVTIPEPPQVYSFGGHVSKWPDIFREYVRDVEVREDMKLRYGGAMIGDVNQVLTYGGLFCYPELTTAPQGKLRLQFEGFPVAYILECVDGASSNGDRSILEVEPTDLHQRVPVYVGNRELVAEVEALGLTDDSGDGDGDGATPEPESDGGDAE